MKKLTQFPLEAVIWLGALILLMVYQPEGNHFTICPLYHLGFEHCPGCGLGRSISLFFRGDFAESFDYASIRNFCRYYSIFQNIRTHQKTP